MLWMMMRWFVFHWLLQWSEWCSVSPKKWWKLTYQGKSQWSSLNAVHRAGNECRHLSQAVVMYKAKVKRNIQTDLKYFFWKFLFLVTCTSAPQHLTSVNPYLRAELWIKVQRQGWLCWGKNNVHKERTISITPWRTLGVCMPIKPVCETGCEYSCGCEQFWRWTKLSVFVSSILLKVCTFLRNRFQEIRDVARNTLIKIMEVLGVHYLLYILKEMRSALIHGYQVMLKFFLFCSL